MDDGERFRARYGPTALVAGAAVGLGAEWSRQLARRGLDVVLVDRDARACKTTARAVAAEAGVEALPVVLDLGRDDLAAALTPALAGRQIGLVVYNAAIGTVSRFLDLTPAHMQAMLDVNCRGAMLLVHALAPSMVARGRGGIVLMSSMSGSFGSEQLAVYAATKAFLLVFGEALWAELRPHGVDVLVVQPGSTRTPGWQSSQPAEQRGPGPHVMEPGPVVSEALEALGGAPHLVPGAENREGARFLASLPRRQAVELMSRLTRELLPNR
ncbi:MAG TPA: SDR family NAD(P)-dependent oxidoreductase [Candidatus Limnocylindria bacterium]|nr:SDR family NAD(P)-dependent oxidoreductase [Candidatus Limnocylindria bacterium]